LLIKLIYFEDELFLDIEIRDLIEGAEKANNANNFMSGLESLL
jgi:hypothetical protein